VIYSVSSYKFLLLSGCVVLGIASQTVLPYSLDAWAYLVSTNAVGAYSLAWSAGITFMLTMTVGVLQLREVLHPALCARLIRPQEGHDDLISSLVQEGGLLHARRVLTSTMVYLLLMVVFLYAPLRLYSFVAQFFLTDAQRAGVFAFKVWYGVPLLQMPLELIVSHVVFLSLLDRKKDVMGTMQHQWLLVTCRWLGLTRFILPSPLIKKHVSDSVGIVAWSHLHLSFLRN
jgi:E3 ubiquitin-protein ligase MARCH6